MHQVIYLSYQIFHSSSSTSFLILKKRETEFDVKQVEIEVIDNLK